MTAETAAAAAIRRELETLAEAVALAGTALRNGSAIDLTGLDGRVAAMCSALADLDDGERRGLGPALGDLIARLDRLAADLAHARDRMAGPDSPGPEYAGPNPARAAGAYRKAPR